MLMVVLFQKIHKIILFLKYTCLRKCNKKQTAVERGQIFFIGDYKYLLAARFLPICKALSNRYNNYLQIIYLDI